MVKLVSLSLHVDVSVVIVHVVACEIFGKPKPKFSLAIGNFKLRLKLDRTTFVKIADTFACVVAFGTNAIDAHLLKVHF